MRIGAQRPDFRQGVWVAGASNQVDPNGRICEKCRLPISEHPSRGIDGSWEYICPRDFYKEPV